jgi:predicted DNA-binding transcriptional regulator YafY
VAQRRVRVALLVEEEGLERGAIARIAGWLDVSPSTIGRDIRALIAAGDPVVTGAAVRAQRRRSGNGR